MLPKLGPFEQRIAPVGLYIRRVVPKGPSGRIFHDSEINLPREPERSDPCLLIPGAIGLTVTPPRELAAMKYPFPALLNDAANRVGVLPMRNPVQNHVTNSALTRLGFTTCFEIDIQRQAAYFVLQILAHRQFFLTGSLVCLRYLLNSRQRLTNAICIRLLRLACAGAIDHDQLCDKKHHRDQRDTRMQSGETECRLAKLKRC